MQNSHTKTHNFRRGLSKKIASACIILGVFFVSILFVSDRAFAILYQPGQTLEPACAPTDISCGVIPPASSGVNTDITELGGLTTPLSVSQGGTGTSTFSIGSIIFASGVQELSALPIGTNGQVLRVVAGSPVWDDDTGGTSYFAGDGLSLTGTTFHIDLDGGTLSVSGSGLKISDSFVDTIFTLSDWNTTTTDALTEGTTNLYYTDTRSRSALSSAATGLTYSTSTGVFSLHGDYIIPLTNSTTDWQTAFSWGNHSTQGYLTDISAFDTDALTEGTTNLYYTDTRSRSALSSAATGLTYATSTGVFSLHGDYTIPLTASTTDWQTAFSWGNHSSAGYLVASNNLSDLTNSSTARTNLGLGGLAVLNSIDISDHTNLAVTVNGLELADDTITLSTGYIIPLTNSTTDWQTAYGWGDHGTAGYFDTVGVGIATSGTSISLDIDSLTEGLTFESGDFIAFYDTSTGQIRKVDYDQLPGAGGGITSLNGLTNPTQAFATSSDTNIGITVSSTGSTHTFTPTWTGMLAVTRGGTGANNANDARDNLGLGTVAVLNSIDISDHTNLGVTATGLSLSGDTIALTAGYTIPLTNSTTDWQTAFSWGNHSTQGYLTDISAFDTDALTEGTTNLYYTDTRSRSALSSAATGLTYATSTGVFSLHGDYTIPLTASTTDWQTAFSWGNHSSAGYLVASNNLSDLTNSSTARTNLGLGGLAVQDASTVNITGGTINGVTIGASTPGVATFTNVTSTNIVLIDGFYQGGLGSCSSTTTEKIVYNSATGKFECATDQAGSMITPGGSDTYIQINEGGSFAGYEGFRFMSSTNSLHVGNGSSAGTINLTGSDEWMTLDAVSGISIENEFYNSFPEIVFSVDMSGSIFARGTLEVEDNTTLAGLSFSNATGTSVTSTHAFFTNLTFGSATGTSIGVVDISSTGLSTLATTTIMNGYLGIGTTTPQSALHLTSGSFLQSVSMGGQSIIGSTTDAMDGPVSVVVQGSYAYIANYNDASISIVNISNPSNPIVVGNVASSTAMSGNFGLRVSGNYVYVVSDTSNSLTIIDISNPSSPEIISVLQDATNLDGAIGLYVSGQYAYTANTNDNSLGIIDVSDPQNPYLVSTLASSTAFDRINSVYVAGKYVYTASIQANALHIVDVSNPLTPVIVGGVVSSTALGSAYTVVVSGGYAYVTSETGDSLAVIDVTDPTAPVIVGRVQDATLEEAFRVVVAGKYAYVASFAGNSMQIIDVSNPANPTIVGGVVDATNLEGAADVVVVGKYAYVTSYMNNTFSIIDLTGIDAPTAHIGALESGSINVIDNIIIGNDAYVRNGLVVGSGGILSQGGLSVSGGDIRQTGGSFIQKVGSDPVIVGSVVSSTAFVGSRGVHVSGKYAYSVNSFENSFYITDISDPTNPQLIGSLQDNTNLQGPYRIHVVGYYAYVVTFSSGSLQVIDISDPTNPTFVGGVTDYGIMGGARSLYVSGSKAYITAGDVNTLSIIDISNPLVPTILGSITSSTALWGIGDVHVSGKYAYVVNRSDNSLRVIDISDPTAPVIVGGVKNDTDLSVASSVYVSGRYAYVANMDDHSLRVIDISDPTAPVIVGGVKDDSLLGGAISVRVAGAYAYVATMNDNSLRVVDISDPTAPVIVGGVKDNSLLDSVHGMHISGKYAYTVGLFSDYLSIIDLTGIDAPTAHIGALESGSINVIDNITIGNDAYINNGLVVGSGGILSQGGLSVSGEILSRGDIRQTGGSFVQTVGSDPSIVGSINLPAGGFTVYVSGKYAYVGMSSIIGTTCPSQCEFHIYDISQTSNPLLVGSLDMPASVRGVYVINNYAYITTETSGDDFHVVDISNPSSPVQVASLNMPNQAHGISISGKYAYVTNFSVSGTTCPGQCEFHIIDISNPLFPAIVASVNLPSNSRAVHTSGKYAYVGFNITTGTTCPGQCEFHIYDITNPVNPSLTGSLEISGSIREIYVSGRYAYLVTGSGPQDFHVVDISDPSTPVKVGSAHFLINTLSVKVAGNYAYVGLDNASGDNCPEECEFRVLDISDPTAPYVVGAVEISDSIQNLFIAGKYAYAVTASSCTSNCALYIIDLTGVDAPTANIGALQSNSISVTENLSIGNNAYIGNGLVVGSGGILSYGGFSFSNPSSTSYIGGSLIFGNTTLDTDVILQLPNDASSTAKAYLWDTYSDARIKTDQVSLEYGLSEILRLQPKRYTQKNSYWDNGELILSGGNNTFGLIAQEVYDILPELVSRPGDETRGLWGLDYSKLGPVLVRAIQEQQMQIDGLHFYLAGISTSSPTTLSEEELLFASNRPITSAITYLSNRLLSGAIIIKDFMAERITAVVGIFHRMRTEVAEVNTGVQIRDQGTGEWYCMTLVYGEWQTVPGECEYVEHSWDSLDSTDETTDSDVFDHEFEETVPDGEASQENTEDVEIENDSAIEETVDDMNDQVEEDNFENDGEGEKEDENIEVVEDIEENEG